MPLISMTTTRPHKKIANIKIKGGGVAYGTDGLRVHLFFQKLYELRAKCLHKHITLIRTIIKV